MINWMNCMILSSFQKWTLELVTIKLGWRLTISIKIFLGPIWVTMNLRWCFFGLFNAHVTFQALMNQVFQPFLRKLVMVFFDDKVIYSISLKDRLEHLVVVSDTLSENSLYVKRLKCSFGEPKVEYLVHVVTGEGVTTNPSRIQEMLGCPTPKSLKDLRGFLGLTGYYMKYGAGYSTIFRLLTNLF